MRILFLNYEFPPLGGGGGIVSSQIAEGLASLGHKVDVVTAGYRGLPSFEEKGNLRIFRVKCRRAKKEISNPFEQLSYLFAAHKLCKKLLRKNKYDVNHTHFIVPTGILSLKLKKKFGLKYIVTSHGSDVLGYNKRFRLFYPLIAGVWRRIVRNSEMITSPSEFLKQKIVKQGVDAGKIDVVANGIPDSKFKPMKKEKQILVVSRLFENKGVQDFLEALKGVDIAGWNVVVVGDGPYKDELIKKARKSNLNIEFKGLVDNKSKELAEIYGKSMIFVFSSYYESFGLVILEALSSGCYVISSDVGAAKELVKDGTVYNTGNVAELRTAIEYAVKNHGEIAKKAAKYHDSVEKYTWKHLVKKYEGLLGNKKFFKVHDVSGKYE